MRCSGLYVVCLALCCLHTETETVRYPDDHRSNVRRRRDDKDGLALSREIFRNITKQLRENIRREGVTDKSDQLLRSKVEDTRHFVPSYHHHEHHWGPYFEEEKLTHMAAHVGAEALLNCRVSMLKDKTVMWLRNTTDSAQLLLTVGPATYTGDSRVSVKFQYPNNWRLSMNPVRVSDSGLYMCQISTHPPRTIFANLTVLPPLITINGDQNQDRKDIFYKAGSAIKLSCIISEEYLNSVPASTTTTTTTSSPTTTLPTTTTTELTTKLSTVFNKIDVMLNKSWSVETTTITSTVSISTTTKKAETTTEMTTLAPTDPPVVNNVFGLMWKKDGKEFIDKVSWRNFRMIFVSSATISVASASQNDSGNYTCQLQNHSQITINVHVLIGENQAAVHHDTWNKGTLFWQPQNLAIASVIALLLFLT